VNLNIRKLKTVQSLEEFVRKSEKIRVYKNLEAMLLEGINSGSATEMTPDDWEDIRQAVHKKITKQTTSN
jgi:antitoxin ParD1/3/4